MPHFVNIAGYKFVHLEQLSLRRRALLDLGIQLDLRGTILLSSEGINLFVAGDRDNIDKFLNSLRTDAAMSDFRVKESFSDHQPFTRFLVRIKKEIIAFGAPGIDPAKRTSPKISAHQLREWLDEGRDVALLDVRNNFEVDLGTFENATAVDIDHFRDFPAAVDKLPASMKTRPVVMFCTGGIRCEKAGPLLESRGFAEVLQLDGGILQYFEDVGARHYRGDCFVFDKRVAVDPNLRETQTQQCYVCQRILTLDDQRSPHYHPGRSCPYCFRSTDEVTASLIATRHRAITALAKDLPGCTPYDNVRPMHVPKRFDGLTALNFLLGYHPHIEERVWKDKLAAGHLMRAGVVLAPDDRVRAGQRIEHLLPATIEPRVNANIEILHEDQAIIVINKPAPLPTHPSGRFNRNTLSYLLNQVYATPVRIVHRLDANTSGVMVLAKTRAVAQHLQRQFNDQRVDKQYLARVLGHPPAREFEIDHPIGCEPIAAGARAPAATGLASSTAVRVLSTSDDGTSRVEIKPRSGRTNQIRAHLWSVGYPIAGDPTYRLDQSVQPKQTLAVDDPPMCLHAAQITFEHPASHEQSSFRAPAPAWLVTSAQDHSPARQLSSDRTIENG